MTTLPDVTPPRLVAAVSKVEPLDQVLATAHREFAAQRPVSQQLHEQACRVMPGGNTRSVLYHSPFPLRISHAADAVVFDVDGLTYVDLLGEYTAGLYGHSNSVITGAMHAAVDAGLTLGAHTVNEVRLAESIVQRFPPIQMVRFTNSGTEANMMAVALARVATNRPGIAVMQGGYHGGFMYYGGQGSPVNAPYPTTVLPFNDAATARALLREKADSIAAVVIEPVMGSAGCIPPTGTFLQDIATATAEVGALLIADEVMTSRLSPQGACPMFGITPDLMTLGKYLGGGASFGAFGGRADLMAKFDPTMADALPHAGTFNNNTLSMSAGLAGLSEVLTDAVVDEINTRGDYLRVSLNDVLGQFNWSATGMGSMIGIHPVSGSITSPHDLRNADPRLRDLLFLRLLDRGWYIAARGFIALSLAITDEHAQAFVADVADVFSETPQLHVN